MNKKYVEAFKQAATAARSSYKLTGDLLLVEKIEQDVVKGMTNAEGRSISIEIVSDKNQIRNDVEAKKPVFVRVLAVGEGYDDEPEAENSGMYVQPGDIILVGRVSVSYFSTFGDLKDYEQETIGITRQSEVQIHFPDGDRGYGEFFKVLNTALSET